MIYQLVRRLLFKFDPEISHAIALKGLQALQKCHLTKLLPKPTLLPRTVMGINFPNPVGLAAGLDKNAEYIDGLTGLGFGFIEVGTVTPRAQPGNPKPRLFRLTTKEALINRLGFNNRGLEYLLQQIQHVKFKGILGINIGKNADTPLEKAVNDYVLGLRGVYRYASYVTVNLSSPNTPGLRDLQYGAQREALFATLKAEQQQLTEQFQRYVPLVIKIAPDLDIEQIGELAQSLLKHRIDGVIATNTTLSRSGVAGLAHANETGGLSGKPLMILSTQVVKELHNHLQNKIPIIAVGGIMSAEDVKAKFAVGASLVQIYTGLIYRGPGLIRDIVKGL